MRPNVIAVVTILLCLLSQCALADAAADLAAARAAIAAKDWDKADSLISGFAAAHPEDPATPHLLKGEALQGQGKWQKALGEIEAGLDPNNSPSDAAWIIGLLDSIQSSNPKPGLEMLLGLGNCYRMATDFAKGSKFYDAVLAQPGIPTDRAKIARRWLLVCDIRTLNWARVEREIEQTTAESPESAPWAYFALGRYYQVAGRYGEAVAAFDRVLLPDKQLPKELDPKRVGTAFLDSCIGAEQWDKATDLAKRLAALYPRDTAYQHECTGAIYQGQKKYPEAIAELKLAIEPGILSLSKDAVRARKRLAECYRDSLKPSEAAPLIQELVDRYPKTGPDVPTMLGKMYQGMKQYDKAIAAYKVLITNCPNSRWQVWDACFYIGECCYAQGRGEEALTYIREFYAKHPDRPMDFAIAYGKTLLYPGKKPAEAAEVLAKAMAEHPQDKLVPEVRNLLVDAYSDSGQIAKLAEVVDSMAAAAKTSDKAEILLWLGNRWCASHKYREAAGVYRAVLALSESGTAARAQAEYQLAVCYHSSNMQQAARRAMQRVSERYPDLEWAKKARGMLYVWDTYGRSSD